MSMEQTDRRTDGSHIRICVYFTLLHLSLLYFVRSSWTGCGRRWRRRRTSDANVVSSIIISSSSISPDLCASRRRSRCLVSEDRSVASRLRSPSTSHRPPPPPSSSPSTTRNLPDSEPRSVVMQCGELKCIGLSARCRRRSRRKSLIISYDLTSFALRTFIYGCERRSFCAKK